MDIVVWIGWALFALLRAVWSVVWFLVSGWVSTLLQIALLVAVLFFLKYGWQRAPGELLRRTRSLARFVWGWVRAKDAQAAPRTYEVVKGDSLSKIAKRVYGDASKWRQIFEANTDKLKDPDKIYPGQVLTIPPL